MPSLTYGVGAYQRSLGDFPPLVLINMHVEPAKTSEGGYALQSRNGLATSTTVGTGPINGIFSKQGCFAGDIFAVSNATLFRGAANIGVIAGAGSVSMAGSDLELVITRGTTARSYLAAGIADIVFPDTANVRAVAYIGGLHVYIRDASHKFYWSAPLNGRSVAALDFASAEREPDQLLDVAVLGDNLWLFGQSTVEVWAHSGETLLPFTRFEQTTWDKGIYATGCVVNADNGLVWVGSDCKVYRSGEVPERVSDHWLEEKLIAASSISVFTYIKDGHEFVAVRTNTQTYILNLATNEWSENQTSAGQWIARCAATIGKTSYFGNQTDGKIMTFSGWLDIAATLERRFSAIVALDVPLSIDNIRLWVNGGGGGTIDMRVSDDAGRTFGAYESESLGASTEYRTVPEWRALGMFDFPGFLAEFKCTSNNGLRISAVKMNDPGGGRARP